MLYNSFSLDGDYVMDYTEEDYTSESVPEMTKSASVVKGAIPGYFEDMTAKFQRTNFYGKIRVNPEYGAQHYPITGVAPDMALPNVYGTFFYFRKFNLETLADGVTIAFPRCISPRRYGSTAASSAAISATARTLRSTCRRMPS